MVDLITYPTIWKRLTCTDMWFPNWKSLLIRPMSRVVKSEPRICLSTGRLHLLQVPVINTCRLIWASVFLKLSLFFSYPYIMNNKWKWRLLNNLNWLLWFYKKTLRFLFRTSMTCNDTFCHAYANILNCVQLTIPLTTDVYVWVSVYSSSVSFNAY